MHRLAIIAATASLVLGATVAQAAEPLTGEQIRAVIIGNTLEGLTATGYAYTEHFRPDGTIHGKGYVGTWTIAGSELCLDYDGAQFDACWGFIVDGSALIWLKHGEVVGPGTLTAGNPYNL